jgi:transcriptional regulator with GAF, ATPase, and Fis domain
VVAFDGDGFFAFSAAAFNHIRVDGALGQESSTLVTRMACLQLGGFLFEDGDELAANDFNYAASLYGERGVQEKALQLKKDAQKVVSSAKSPTPGGNGAGKEGVARLLHEKSPRAQGPYIEVNCAAIPGELIESELFGHVKGSFTSAIKDRKGKFELADGGTLFLDEIGDMALAAQAKVLRALQEGRITPVGGDKDISVNVRVIAATNKDLKKEIAAGNFREDLFHRLSVIPIHVPSLAERLEDIPLLADHFIQLVCTEQGIAPKKIADKAIKELQKLPWTGNVRELRNVIERLVILSGKEISEADVKAYAVPRG